MILVQCDIKDCNRLSSQAEARSVRIDHKQFDMCPDCWKKFQEWVKTSLLEGTSALPTLTINPYVPQPPYGYGVAGVQGTLLADGSSVLMDATTHSSGIDKHGYPDVPSP